MLTKTIIETAMEECSKSTFRIKIGAVIFKGKRILGKGHNEIRSCSLSMKHSHWEESIHAEQAALLNLDWNKLKGCSILVVRLSKKGKLGMCKPCPMCEKLIKHVGLKNIYYTNDKGEIVLEKI